VTDPGVDRCIVGGMQIEKGGTRRK